MASQAAYYVEKAVGHEKEHLKQDVSNYEDVGSGETMKALVWEGKQKVAVGMSMPVYERLPTPDRLPLSHQSTRQNRESSRMEMSFSKLPAPLSAEATSIFSTAASSR